MADIETLTRDGTPWQAHYLDAIDAEACIGCGRCFKVCAQDVLAMRGVDEDGELLEADDDDAERMIMTVANKGACMGCGACARVCAKKAQTHVRGDLADVA